MIIHKNSTTKIKPNFTEGEFFTKSEDFLKKEHWLHDGLPKAAQIIRDFLQSPVIIASTYRTPLGNVLAGGVNDSPHKKQIAMDLHFSTEDSKNKIQSDIASKEVTYQKLRSIGVAGFGLYDWGIHIDFRTKETHPYFNSTDGKGQYSIWDYRGQKKK
jgi:hypothetical protein